MRRKIRIIEISKLNNILQLFNDGYLATYESQTTVLILNKNKEHVGSIYLKKNIGGDTDGEDFFL
jgi:hypothetical protein